MSLTAQDVLALERDCYGLNGDPDVSVCSTCGGLVYRGDEPHTVASCLSVLRSGIEALRVIVVATNGVKP